MDIIILNEDKFDSIIISNAYEYITELLNQAICMEYMTEDDAKNIAIKCLNSACNLVNERHEDDYLNKKEKEQAVKNYITIFSLYLYSKGNTNSVNILLGDITKEFMMAIKWFEEKNIDAYNNVSFAEVIFKNIGYKPAINLCRLYKLAYKFFVDKITEYDIYDIDIENIVLISDDIQLTMEDILYTDMHGASKCNFGFLNYIKVCNNLKAEAEFLNHFSKDEILTVASKTLKTFEMTNEKNKNDTFEDRTDNLAATVFTQFLISCTYHEEKKGVLDITENEAKFVLFEILKDTIDVNELFDNVTKTWFSHLTIDTKEYFFSYRNKVKQLIKDIKERKINNLFYIV